MKIHKLKYFLLPILVTGHLNAEQLIRPELSQTEIDLPVIIKKAKTDDRDKFVLFISGDGGWNRFSQNLVDSYTAEGFNVIALNSFKYFWKKKTPQQAASDIARLLSIYTEEWHKQKIVICGFSFGADVAPFIYTHLPESFKTRVTLVQLISPSSFTDFEIHVMDMFGSGNAVRSMNIASEINLIYVPVICYYGDLETQKPLSNIRKANFRNIILPGDHHYSNNYAEIAKNAL